MLKVGLTGSIAVGKSFVANVLVELGCPVLDADVTAREVVEPQTIGWRRIVESFGRDVLNSDETINRQRLGAIVFHNAEKLKLLNSIVHPLVVAAQNSWLAAQEFAGARLAVIDAALMIESGGYKRFDKIVVVWCDEKSQLERLMRRNNLSADEARRRIAAQLPQSEKKKRADYFIDSSGNFADTKLQTAAVYRQLLNLV